MIPIDFEAEGILRDVERPSGTRHATLGTCAIAGLAIYELLAKQLHFHAPHTASIGPLGASVHASTAKLLSHACLVLQAEVMTSKSLRIVAS